MGTPTSRDAHFIGTPTGKTDKLAEENRNEPTDGSGHASVTLNEQEWPCDLVIQSQLDKDPVIRDLLANTQELEESDDRKPQLQKKEVSEEEAPQPETAQQPEAEAIDSEMRPKDKVTTSPTKEEEAPQPQRALQPEAEASDSEMRRRDKVTTSPKKEEEAPQPEKALQPEEEVIDSEMRPKDKVATSPKKEEEAPQPEKALQPEDEAIDSEMSSKDTVARSPKKEEAPQPVMAPQPEEEAIDLEMTPKDKVTASHHHDSNTVAVAPQLAPTMAEQSEAHTVSGKPPVFKVDDKESADSVEHKGPVNVCAESVTLPLENRPIGSSIKITPRPKPKRGKEIENHVRKCKVIEDGYLLACSLEDKGSLKEAEAQFRRTLGICSTLLGERPRSAHKSMRELRAATSNALDALRAS
jgi:hypothetical protein